MTPTSLASARITGEMNLPNPGVLGSDFNKDATRMVGGMITRSISRGSAVSMLHNGEVSETTTLTKSAPGELLERGRVGLQFGDRVVQRNHAPR